VGGAEVIDLTLQVGSAAHTVVEVEAPDALPCLRQFGYHRGCEATTVRNCRSRPRWTDLAALQPGVEQSRRRPTFAVARIVAIDVSPQLTISGARAPAEPLPPGRRQRSTTTPPAPLVASCRNFGRDPYSGILRPDQQLFGRVRQDSGGLVNAITRRHQYFSGSAYEVTFATAHWMRDFSRTPPLPGRPTTESVRRPIEDRSARTRQFFSPLQAIGVKCIAVSTTVAFRSSRAGCSARIRQERILRARARQPSSGRLNTDAMCG